MISVRRGGVTYVLVLVATLLVAVMGLGGLQATRAQARTANLTREASSTADLALSAIAHARLTIKADANWRTSYASGAWSAEQQLGDGYFSWKIVDAATGGSVLHPGVEPLADTASVRILGKGRVGTVLHVTSVELTMTKEPYEALLSSLHAKGNVTLTSTTFNVKQASAPTTNAIFSTDGTFTNSATVNGNVQAASISGGTINGTSTIVTSPKTAPPDSTWDYYRSKATDLTWAVHFGNPGDGKYHIKTNILTPNMSNFATPITNPDGVYYISVPGGLGTAKVQFDWVRINGTILFDVQGPNTIVHFGGHILWTPARPDYPIALIRNSEFVELDAKGTISQLTEGGNTNGVGGKANFNPSTAPGFPYSGVSDIDTTDAYESRLWGVIHVLGSSNGAPSKTTLFGDLHCTGSIIVPGTVINTNGTSQLTWDNNLLTNPPIGYYTMKMSPVPGSWMQQLLP